MIEDLQLIATQTTINLGTHSLLDCPSLETGYRSAAQEIPTLHPL
jgi:hypothetical protein